MGQRDSWRDALNAEAPRRRSNTARRLRDFSGGWGVGGWRARWGGASCPVPLKGWGQLLEGHFNPALLGQLVQSTTQYTGTPTHPVPDTLPGHNYACSPWGALCALRWGLSSTPQARSDPPTPEACPASSSCRPPPPGFLALLSAFTGLLSLASYLARLIPRPPPWS